MARPPTTAVILAAGLGSRLQDVHPHGPKGLLLIGGAPLVARSCELLVGHGISRIVIVTGHMREAYELLAQRWPQVQLVHNPDYAITGSMASLDCALLHVDEDFLLLESDLIYESRALSVLLDEARADVVLMSSPTGAGDEIWVHGGEELLIAMSKERGRLPSVQGEFVGINRVSATVAKQMRRLFAAHVAEHGHGRMDYETGALVGAAATLEIGLLRVEGLLWGEIDDARHLRRVTEHLWPTIAAKEAPPDVE